MLFILYLQHSPGEAALGMLLERFVLQSTGEAVAVVGQGDYGFVSACRDSSRFGRRLRVINDGTTSTLLEESKGIPTRVVRLALSGGVARDVVVISSLALLGINVEEVLHHLAQDRASMRFVDNVDNKSDLQVLYVFQAAAVEMLLARQSGGDETCGEFFDKIVDGGGDSEEVENGGRAKRPKVEAEALLVRNYVLCTFEDQVEIRGRAYARVGLVGNPSDGYFGRTLSFTIRNFYATVWILPNKEEGDSRISFTPHPRSDTLEFADLRSLHTIVQKNGYDGGIRLLTATCKRFFELCRDKRIILFNESRGFRVRYDTTIPRQLGLAGSSAIVTAFTRSLIKFYNISPSSFSVGELANFVLSVEQNELGITAGLQDRVTQLMQGLVDMDFNKEKMDRDGYGEYTRLPLSLLPKGLFFLAMVLRPKESGKVHSDVRQRWHKGDSVIIEAMKNFACFSRDARVALESHDIPALRSLMNANFDLRREVFGDDVVGRDNLRMVEIGRSLGAACKLPGSGGAVLGLASTPESLAQLRDAYDREGYVFTLIDPVEKDDDKI